MPVIEKSIEVNVPVKTAYNQWTQFEEFPKFMEGVKQVNDNRLHWKANIAGKEKEWDAEITEQIPDQRIAWTSKEGAMNAGLVTFYPVSDAKSKLMLQMEYVPDEAVEKTDEALGLITRRVEEDLKRFKDFIEARGRETGAWRGTVR